MRPYILKDISEGFAEVYHRETGAHLGCVEKRSTSYNLRRFLVVRWWQSRLPDRRLLDGKPDTRHEAAMALVHAGRTP